MIRLIIWEANPKTREREKEILEHFQHDIRQNETNKQQNNRAERPNQIEAIRIHLVHSPHSLSIPFIIQQRPSLGQKREER